MFEFKPFYVTDVVMGHVKIRINSLFSSFNAAFLSNASECEAANRLQWQLMILMKEYCSLNLNDGFHYGKKKLIMRMICRSITKR